MASIGEFDAFLSKSGLRRGGRAERGGGAGAFEPPLLGNGKRCRE